MDTNNKPLVIGNIYTITSVYGTNYKRKEADTYTYNGLDCSTGYNKHVFIKEDGTKLHIGVSTLAHTYSYIIKLVPTTGGTRKIRKEIRKTRARRRNRRKHTRKH